MKILAIETATNACSLGLGIDGVMTTEFVELKRTHSREILPRIANLLTKVGVQAGELDLIVYGKGPGSFTGLRIAVGVVQGLAYGLGVPVVGISTLACCAQGRYRQHGDDLIVVAETARADEVFFGAYGVAEGLVYPKIADAIYVASEAPALPDGSWVGIGSAWMTLQSPLETALLQTMTRIETRVFPLAQDLLDMGLAAFNNGLAHDPMLATPEYLREQVAAKPEKK
ncbi:MAG: tRNA threonylcarbamoyladenosine biosynthesis protein TsaB [Candidatus Pseudothioglobus sp.]|jgi:tRNA threonylcarbamoyladenosine biosynthesis protein TsaB